MSNPNQDGAFGEFMGISMMIAVFVIQAFARLLGYATY